MGDVYLQQHQQHFAQPHIVTHDLLHEELLVCQAKKQVQKVCRAVEQSQYP
ncbi:MAG: hypothetical protein IJ438_01905 [Clostridia bacterium]|nr:hypothetical protein [Clostridia bacterium]